MDQVEQQQRAVEKVVQRNAQVILQKTIKRALAAVEKGSGSVEMDSLDDLRNRTIEAIKSALTRLVKHDAQAEPDLKTLKSDRRSIFILTSLVNTMSLLQTIRQTLLDVKTLQTDSALKARTQSLLDDMETYVDLVLENHEDELTKSVVPGPTLLVVLSGDQVSYSTGGNRTDLVALLSIMSQIWLDNDVQLKETQPQLETINDLLNQVCKSFGTFEPRDVASSSSTSQDGLSTVRSSKPKVERRISEIMDMIAVHSKQLDSQRYVPSSERQKRDELNSVIKVAEKLTGGRLDDQRATSTKMERDEYYRDMEAVVETQIKSSSGMDNQRFKLSAEKLRTLSVNELVHTVETMAASRLRNQDAISAEQRQLNLLNTIADVVEQMRSSSLDDQRFVQGMARQLNMSPEALQSSIDSLPSLFSNQSSVTS